VEERVQKLLIPKLLDAHVQWHTRRRLRHGCDCDWCIEKLVGTRYIGHTPTPWSRWNEAKQQLEPWIAKECHPDEIGYYLVRWARETKREVVRERLRWTKEQVL
jgi:hypothetical protein